MSKSRPRTEQHAFNVLAGAAAVHRGMFLLLKRSQRESFLPSAWGIPAGQAHFGEDVKDASLRELTEETGLHGEAVGLAGYSMFQSRRDSVQLSNLQINFIVETSHSTVTLNPASHSAFQWISMDDSQNDLLDDFTSAILLSVRMYYKEPPSRLRASDGRL